MRNDTITTILVRNFHLLLLSFICPKEHYEEEEQTWKPIRPISLEVAVGYKDRHREGVVVPQQIPAPG